MIIFTILGVFTSIFFFSVILMSIVEGRARNRTNEKIVWNMDKVETLTEELSNERINERES